MHDNFASLISVSTVPKDVYGDSSKNSQTLCLSFPGIQVLLPAWTYAGILR